MVRTTLCAVALGVAAFSSSQSAEDVLTAIFTPATGTPARPSAAIGYIVGGKAAVKTFGKLGLDSARAPDADTVYEIGSITKGLTGILLADMVLAGEVSLHDRLDTLLPGGAAYPEAVRTITLQQLATHSSGLPRLPANLMFGMKDARNPYVHYGREQLETFLRGYAPPPGRTSITPEYSNLGFGLLGFVLAHKAGMPYESLLKARVLEPLGMRDTSATLSADQRRRLAPGHARGAAESNWDFDALAGAGALRSTANDMNKLLAALMRPTASTRIRRAIRLALEPRGDLGVSKIGLGWLTTKQPSGFTMTWHNGGTGGYRTFIGFTPDARAGIVVLTNTGDQGADPLAVQALQKLAAGAGL